MMRSYEHEPKPGMSPNPIWIALVLAVVMWAASITLVLMATS